MPCRSTSFFENFIVPLYPAQEKVTTSFPIDKTLNNGFSVVPNLVKEMTSPICTIIVPFFANGKNLSETKLVSLK